MLPSPPTSSPTTSDRTAPFWYPLYEIPWDVSGCSNKLPLPYKNIRDRPNFESGEKCCKTAYRGQISKSCLCNYLDEPRLGCPGVVAYEVTTITSVVSSTITLGNIDVPTSSTEREELVSTLEQTIYDMLVSSMGSDHVQEVNIISIGGVNVERLRRLVVARLISSSSTDVEFEAVVTWCSGSDEEGCGDENSSNDSIGVVVWNEVRESMQDSASLESAARNSGNTILSTVSVDSVIVNPSVKTTSATRTGVGVVSFAIHMIYKYFHKEDLPSQPNCCLTSHFALPLHISNLPLYPHCLK